MASDQGELARLHQEITLATEAEEEDMPTGEIHPEMQACMEAELARIEREILRLQENEMTEEEIEKEIEWHTTQLKDSEIIIIEDAEEQVDPQEVLHPKLE